jgi:hypothetical protein
VHITSCDNDGSGKNPDGDDGDERGFPNSMFVWGWPMERKVILVGWKLIALLIQNKIKLVQYVLHT